MSEAFAKASRLKIRFETPQGFLSVEDLWDLPLSVNAQHRQKRANLDDIAIELDRRIKAANTVSFVHKAANTDEAARLAFEIVLHIIEVRQAEAAKAAEQADNAIKKQRILEILARKQDEALASKSVEELTAIAATL